MPTFDLPEIISPPEDTRTKSRNEYYARMNLWCNAAEEEGKALQQDVSEFKDIQNALDYLVGMQWKEAMPSYRAKPVSNEFMTMFWETVGLLTDIRPKFVVKDAGGSGEYSETETVLNEGAKAWISTQKYEQQLGFSIMWGMLTSAPAKLWWNPFARGNSGDPEDGDIGFEAVAPTSLLRLGEGGSIQDDECVIHRRVRTIDWIKRAYPTMGKYVRPEAEMSQFTIDTQFPLGVAPQLYPPLSGGMKTLLGIGDKEGRSQSIYPKAEVQEFWRNNDAENETGEEVRMGPKAQPWSYIVKPGKKLYPRGQIIVRSKEGVILYDQPNPYYHRRKPFADCNLLGVPWQKYAMSVVKPWMTQQDILNQMMAGILQTVKKAVSPALLAAKSAINPASMKAIDASKPNLKITYSQNAPHPPSWQTPPVLPTYVLQTYSMVLNSMKQSSGAAAVGDAMSKKQVPAGDSLDKITFAKNTPIRFMAKNIESFVDDIGQMWIADFLQFYDAAMRVELIGKKGIVASDTDDRPGSLIPDGINSETFVRRWHFKTEKGSILNAQKQEKLQIAFALRKGRDLSRSNIFKMLDWNIDEAANDKELAKEAQAMAAAAPPKGKK